MLGKLGFEKVLHPHSVYHTILEKKLFHVNVIIELHSSLPGITYLYQYPLIGGFWDMLIEKEVEGVPLLAMLSENMFLILALHAFREGYIKLKDLSDMVAITDSTPKFNWKKIEEYANKAAWDYILTLPLYAYTSLKQILNEEYPKELRTIKNHFLQHPYKQSYPITHSILCNSISCDKKCKNCLLLIQKKIPGFPFTLSIDYFIKYFPIRFRLSTHFLVTYVQKDCGVKYAFKCCINMMKALIQTSIYVLRSIFKS